MTPVRITYVENAEHFAEGRRQAPSRPAISEKSQRIFLAAIIVGTLIFFCVQQYRKSGRLGVPIGAAMAVLLIMAFWLWFFKKIGLYRPNRVQHYEWTEKDSMRIEKRYQKMTGKTGAPVSCQFEEDGLRLNPDLPEAKFYEWNTIGRVIERPAGLLIYPRKFVYYWFPKAAFATGADYEAVLNVVASRVKTFEKFDVSGLAIIALGSNLGESPELIRRAMERLREFSTEPLLKSSLWQTTPVDCPPGSPPFVNAVVGLHPMPDETPESMLKKLQSLEKEFGRQPKKVMNEPRPLDLDLIAFGNAIRNTPQLTLPHPRAQERRFVLQPLTEISPDLVLPGQSRTVAQLLAGLPEDAAMSKLT